MVLDGATETGMTKGFSGEADDITGRAWTLGHMCGSTKAGVGKDLLAAATRVGVTERC